MGAVFTLRTRPFGVGGVLVLRNRRKGLRFRPGPEVLLAEGLGVNLPRLALTAEASGEPLTPSR